MTYSIETQGADRLASLFGALETEVARAQVNAINAGATEFRRGFVDDIHQATGLKKKLLRERIRIRRAKQANPQARLVPDSQGLPITEYVWRPEPAGASHSGANSHSVVRGLEGSGRLCEPGSRYPLAHEDDHQPGAAPSASAGPRRQCSGGVQSGP